MTSREFRLRLVRRGKKAGVHVPSDLSEKLEAYFRLLALWNKRINLTALDLVEGNDEAIDRLLVEPLVARRFLPSSSVSVIDIGSGGGSPAIPLKLAAPAIGLTMVESKVRKSVFLREAVRELGVEATARVETARYEELLTKPELHEASDVLTVRAVRVESRVLLRLQAFVRPGGTLLLFRGATPPDLRSSLPPPLFLQSTYPLVEATRSRLLLIQKALVGIEAPGAQRY